MDIYELNVMLFKVVPWLNIESDTNYYNQEGKTE
jgi:hypothetical protein